MDDPSSAIYARIVDFGAHGGGGGWWDDAEIMMTGYFLKKFMV